MTRAAEAARLFGFHAAPPSLLEPSRLRLRRRAIASPNLPSALEPDPDREFELAPELVSSSDSYSVNPNSSLQFIATCAASTNYQAPL